ncbi:hypothetical protein JOM56_009380 [Amanita muscaria]
MAHATAKVTAVDSPRSSLTILISPPCLCRQNDPGRTSRPSSLNSPVEERSGREVEQYTDDPNDLPSKTPAGLKQAIVPAEDPNLVMWDGPDDPENPQNWSNRYKGMIAIIAIVMTINVTFASTAPAITSQLLAKQFGVTAEVSYLVTSTFLFGYAFGPLFWGPGSELIGTMYGSQNCRAAGSREIVSWRDREGLGVQVSGDTGRDFASVSLSLVRGTETEKMKLDGRGAAGLRLAHLQQKNALITIAETNSFMTDPIEA